MRYKIDNRCMKQGRAAFAAWFTVTSLLALPTMQAQQHAPSPKAVVQVESEDAPTATKKPGEEPVRIHGHWILDVKDANGKVVEHRDFENSLKQTGTDVLTLLLVGRASSGGFTIRAVQSSAGSMQTYQMSPDYLVRPTFPCPLGTSSGSNVVYCVKGLQQSVVLPAGCAIASCTGNTSIVLQSQFTATAPILVDTLTTYPLICKGLDSRYLYTGSPSDCSSNASLPSGTGGYDFTGTTIAPLSIDTGQTLAITVTLSFS
jgi:hypothetical protein